MPVAPLDILAQQIVATVASDDSQEDDLFAMCRRAWPYRELSRGDFDEVVAMLSDGIATGNRTGALFAPRSHQPSLAGTAFGSNCRRNIRWRNPRNGRLSGCNGRRPDVRRNAQRRFCNRESDGQRLPTWKHIVADPVCARRRSDGQRCARSASATVPFGLAKRQAARRSCRRSCRNCRRNRATYVPESVEQGASWLQHETRRDDWAARQAANYVASQVAAVDVIPTQRKVVFERFFDESGGMQLVIHAPFGARINRAWGLALRKCFCRTFDFELQAVADDNGIVLSIGPQQSFPLEQMFGLIDSAIARDVLIQAPSAVPMFLVRWRWNVTRALAVLRFRGGKKVPIEKLLNFFIRTYRCPACTTADS